MKIQFERQDSFYKITKTIEKIPDQRKVVFVINSDNNFFANDWWGQQFHELCISKQLDYVIKTTDTKTKNYCERVGLICEYDGVSHLSKMISIVYSFFFKIRDFHYYITHQKKYIKYVIFFIEGLLLLGVVLYVYGSLIPKAVITITPSYDIEDVSYNFHLVPESEYHGEKSGSIIQIPYYQGTLPYHRILRTPIQSIRYSAQTAKGNVILRNTSGREYALKPYTRFITDGDLVFKTTHWVNVPANGQVAVELVADDVDDKGQLMGIKGNISSGTLLYIRNLTESRVRKLIVATVVSDFVGGDTLARGIVTQQDINAFDAFAKETIAQSAPQIIRESIKDQDIIPLYYSGFVSGVVDKVNVDAKVGAPMIEFDGTIDSSISYRYIKWSDFTQAIDRYFAQRSTQSLRLVSVQRDSLKMFEPLGVTTGIYSVPMSISTFWSYNFQSDIGGIKAQIVQTISGMSKEQAHEHILSYPDISVAKISITPFWYQVIPSIKSRIEFNVVESTKP